MGVREICTFVESLAIESIASRRERVLDRYFQAAEIEALAGLPDRTVGGHLALKRAALALLQAIGADQAAAEQDVAVKKNDDGAPQLVFPAEIDRLTGGEVKASISHTRDHAYGMAAIAVEKKTDGA